MSKKTTVNIISVYLLSFALVGMTACSDDDFGSSSQELSSKAASKKASDATKLTPTSVTTPTLTASDTEKENSSFDIHLEAKDAASEDQKITWTVFYDRANPDTLVEIKEKKLQTDAEITLKGASVCLDDACHKVVVLANILAEMNVDVEGQEKQELRSSWRQKAWLVDLKSSLIEHTLEQSQTFNQPLSQAQMPDNFYYSVKEARDIFLAN